MSDDCIFYIDNGMKDMVLFFKRKKKTKKKQNKWYCCAHTKTAFQ